MVDNCPNLTHLGVFKNEKKFGSLRTLGMDRVLVKCRKLRVIETDVRSAQYLTKAVGRYEARNETLALHVSIGNLNEFKVLCG